MSIGSLVSALWAMSRNIDEVTSSMAGWCRIMKGGYSLITDITYPAVSILSGRKFNSTIEALFKNKQIEDLWIPYFCVTTDITASGMRIHTHGSLWRYVRASMSLSWYSPPLCDPVDSHMLLDGGYVNNLPADVLKALGAKLVIAVDVGSQDETDLFDYGDFLSGWWVLLRRLSPFHDAVKVLSAAEIESRIAYVCCSRQLQEVKCSDYCKYIRPPIDKYSTFQFRAFEQIKDIGYQHGKTIFPDETAGKAFLAEGLPNKKSSSHMFTSYVDLAEKMYKKKPNNLTGVTVVEEEGENNDNDDDYDEIEDPSDNKLQAVKLKKKVRMRRPTPPPMSVSHQSLFTDRKFARLNAIATQDGPLGRGTKAASETRLKAKSGALARAAYRTKASRKRSTVSVSESIPSCSSDMDVLSEEDATRIAQVKSDSDLPSVCDRSLLTLPLRTVTDSPLRSDQSTKPTSSETNSRTSQPIANGNPNEPARVDQADGTSLRDRRRHEDEGQSKSDATETESLGTRDLSKSTNQSETSIPDVRNQSNSVQSSNNQNETSPASGKESAVHHAPNTDVSHSVSNVRETSPSACDHNPPNLNSLDESVESEPTLPNNATSAQEDLISVNRLEET